MKFINVDSNSKITSTGIPADVVSRLFNMLGDRSMDALMNKLVAHLEDNRKGMVVLNGSVEVLSVKNSAFALLDSDAMISFACPDGDVWYAYNDPCKESPVVSHTQIAIPDHNAPSKVMQWLMTGERGESSETMCVRLYGYPSDKEGANHPYDAADLRRCRLFVEAADCENRVHEMAEVSPEWKAISGQWASLCAMMDQETPDWRTAKGKAIKTNELLNEVLESCQSNRSRMKM